MQRFHIRHAVSQLGAVLFAVIALGGTASSQDAETVKATLIKSLAKIENYSAAAMKGRWVHSGTLERTGEFQFRGEKMWLAFEARNLNQPAKEEAARIKARGEIMRTQGLLHTSEFDGKKFYSFDPYNLALRAQTTSKQPTVFRGLPLLPKNWLYMGGAPTQLFSRFIGDAEYGVKVEELGGGRWKLSQSDLGSRLPEEIKKKFIGVKDRHIIVDEKCDFLVTEYFGKGAKVEVSGTLEWENQDGNWYVKHGKQLFGEDLYAEWFIDDITFDERKCRTQFDELGSTVPTATRIDVYDEKGQRVHQTYKDGDDGRDGEAEHRLRLLEWSKRQSQGFK